MSGEPDGTITPSAAGPAGLYERLIIEDAAARTTG